MRGVWASRSSDPDVKMLWAACCLGFFGFLRVGEMTAPQQGVFDPDVHLGFADIAVDDPVTPSFIRVTIKQSKTDPFRQGVQLFIGRTQSDLCPVAAMLGYLDVRGSGPGPLFRFVDGAGLTRSRFVAQIREALRVAGVDESRYNGHSFRIGAATTAAARGIEDCVIKTLGRWESTAYLQYVRIPRRPAHWLLPTAGSPGERLLIVIVLSFISVLVRYDPFSSGLVYVCGRLGGRRVSTRPWAGLEGVLPFQRSSPLRLSTGGTP